MLEALHGQGAGQALVDGVADICPDFATMTIAWALGGVQARPGLDLQTRTFVCIAAGGPATRNALEVAKQVFAAEVGAR